MGPVSRHGEGMASSAAGWTGARPVLRPKVADAAGFTWRAVAIALAKLIAQLTPCAHIICATIFIFSATSFGTTAEVSITVEATKTFGCTTFVVRQATGSVFDKALL